MKNGLKVLLIVIFIAVSLVGLWFFGTINCLSLFNDELKSEQFRIEAMLQSRSNLISNMVHVISSDIPEEETFTEINDARLKLAGSIKSEDMKSIIEANSDLNSALVNLLTISDNYTILKNNSNFMELKNELTRVEKRLGVIKDYYNDRVSSYNKLVTCMPESIIAKMYGYNPMPKFKNS